MFEQILAMLDAAGIQLELDELVQAVMASKARPARAVSKLLHDRGHKVDEQLLSRIGSLLKLAEYRLEERERINWRAGDFGDRGSCFWGSHATSRDNLSLGAPEFRAFVVYNGDRGVARCLSFEIDGGRLFFNFYNLSLLEFRYLLARAGWEELYPVDARYAGRAFYLNGGNEVGINALFTKPVEVLDIDPDYVEEVEHICAVCYCHGATHQTSVGIVCADCFATQFERCYVCERMHPIADIAHVLPSAFYICRDCSPAPIECFRPGAEGRYGAVLQVLASARAGVIPDGDAIDLRHVALMTLNELQQVEFINEVELIADEILEELARTAPDEWPFHGHAVAHARSAKRLVQAARNTASIRLRAEYLLDAVQRIRGGLEDAPARFAKTVWIPEVQIHPLELDEGALLAAIDRCAGLRNAVLSDEVAFSEAAEDIVFFVRAARQLHLKAARNPLEQYAMHRFADTADLAYVRLAS